MGPAVATLPLQQIEAYWRALRDGRDVPWRSDVDPRGLEPHLDAVFLAERIAPGTARLRIAGAGIGRVIGLEARGLPLSALFRAGARKVLSEAIERCCTGKAPLRLTLHTPLGHLAGYMLLLPLRDDEGRITRLLGGLAPATTLPTSPTRLTIGEILELGGAPRDQSADTDAPTLRPSKVPHLRIVGTP
ncbi:PAS domain-containing protein [Pseudaestuariivita sp.]|uniref:PAS domain-containing protein n=1 Tax=Pseudaestuariivita sp. TaxID=2211669 RepID=UPI00405865FF